MDVAASAKRKQAPTAAAATAVSDAAAGAASEPVPTAAAAASSSPLPRVAFWQLPLSVDLRALAFMRMSIALLLIHDIGVRLSTFDIFYSDSGAWPLENHIRDLEGEMMFSIFFACHHDIWQTCCFALALCLCVLFLIGYQTRWVKFAVWAMMISIQNRMTIGASGGDDLLAGVMFFSMFLPIEARFSVDAALQRRPRRGNEECAAPATPAAAGPSNGAASDVTAATVALPAAPSRRTCNAHVSVASFALVLQPCIMYVFSGLLKTGKAWYPDCTALWYALSGLDYVRPAGIWLRETASFEMLKLITLATLVLEFVGPLFFFSPWKHAAMRVAAVVAFCGFHLGIMLTLALGNFPIVCCVVLLTLLPRQAWDALEDALARVAAVGCHDDGDRCGSAVARAAAADRQNKSVGESALRRTVPLLLVMPQSGCGPATDALARQVEQQAHRERVEAWQKVAALGAHFGLLSFDVADGSLPRVAAAAVAAGGSTCASPRPAPVAVQERKSRSALVVLDEDGRETRNNAALLTLLSRSLPTRLLRRCTGLRLEWFAVAFLPLFTLVKAISRSPSALSWLHWLLPWSPAADASGLRSRWPHRASWPRNALCAVGLAYVLLQNVSTVAWVKEHYPAISALNTAPWGHPAMLLKLDQRWAMFAPDPYSRVGWLVLRGELRLSAAELEQSPRPAARYVDAETLSLSSAPSFDKPALLSAKYSNVYFYDFFDNMEGNEDHYGPYASYYCRRWNLHHADTPSKQLHQIDMFIMEHFVTLPGEKTIPIKKSLVWQQLCDLQDGEP